MVPYEELATFYQTCMTWKPRLGTMHHSVICPCCFQEKQKILAEVEEREQRLQREKEMKEALQGKISVSDLVLLAGTLDCCSVLCPNTC